MGVTIKLSGAPETIARLKGYSKNVITKASQAGTYALGQAIIAKALPITPKRLGALRQSAFCTIPEVKNYKATCTVGMGGPALKYAEAQHQGWIERNGKRITFQHYTEPGTGPLFLDKAAALVGDATAIFTRAFQAVLKKNGSGGLEKTVPSAPPTGSGPSSGKGSKRRRRR